jgi:hypothetical protein
MRSVRMVGTPVRGRADKSLPPGNVSVHVNRSGFYPLIKPGYMIDEGLESIYWSIPIERCPFGNCDPRLRPKRPSPVCE